jgi:hypothetical protein
MDMAQRKFIETTFSVTADDDKSMVLRFGHPSAMAWMPTSVTEPMHPDTSSSSRLLPKAAAAAMSPALVPAGIHNCWDMLA